MNLKGTKKIIAVVLTACMLSSVPAVAANAHHGAAHNSHHSSNYGTYCSYHHKNHQNKSSCKKYCSLHKTTHSNGKKHSTYCSYHKSIIRLNQAVKSIALSTRQRTKMEKNITAIIKTTVRCF